VRPEPCIRRKCLPLGISAVRLGNRRKDRI
jgi:hypothetical protein